jgi:NADH:ubiquinone oxidoreductase subunit 2 (subunit N)
MLNLIKKLFKNIMNSYIILFVRQHISIIFFFCLYIICSYAYIHFLYINEHKEINFLLFSFCWYRYFIFSIITLISFVLYKFVTYYHSSLVYCNIFFFNYLSMVISSILLIHSCNLFLILLFIELININVYFFILNQKNYFQLSNILLKLFFNNCLFALLYLFGCANIWFSLGTLNLNEMTYFGFIGIIWNNEFFFNKIFLIFGSFLVLFSFFIKLGLPLMHVLVFNVYKELNWFNFLFIVGLLKFIFFQIFFLIVKSLYFVLCLNNYFLFYVFFILFSIVIVISPIMTYNQKGLREFFYYSSSSSYGFTSLILLFVCNLEKYNFSWFYLNINYFLLSLCFYFIIFLVEKKHNININCVVDINLLKIYKDKWLIYFIMFIIYSFMGLPPLPIFLGKFIFIMQFFYMQFEGIFWILFIFIFINVMYSAFYSLRLLKIFLFEDYTFTVKQSFNIFSSNILIFNKKWLFKYIVCFLILFFIFNILFLFFIN